jgi:hypothetical protein
MAFVASSAKGRAVVKETVALSNGTTAYSSAFRVDPDASFVVFGNAEAADLAGACTGEVQGSFDGSTWVTVTSSFQASVDNNTQVDIYTPATLGDFPYYRLAYTSAGNDSANSIVVVVVGAGAAAA